MLRRWELLAVSATFPPRNTRRRDVDGRTRVMRIIKSKYNPLFVLQEFKLLRGRARKVHSRPRKFVCSGRKLVCHPMLKRRTAGSSLLPPRRPSNPTTST
jgi:hypothetical protein